ncbi:MAG: hypothetical protein IT578_12360 [Verrucomicrobiae bacterium]|nr:hypothetical protein [Verrucomicrobiae bacterium]
MKLVNETKIEGRVVRRYEHDSAEVWGYAAPQNDYFYVVPARAPAEKAPLRVVLHSAGHSGDKVLKEAFEHHDQFHYYSDETAHVLYLDCAQHRDVDWWWGHHAIKRTPERYASALFPTEQRVLATIEWVIKQYEADRNRVYLSGISMGGSGSLGIGLRRGDLFAAISVAVPAGVEHMTFRMADGKHPDPPPLINISSHVDRWSKDQEKLLSYFEKNRFFLVFVWGPFGHKADVSSVNPAVYEYPWLSIRKDEAYPVFSHATTDQRYPGHNNKTAPDQEGQINGYFRWKTIEDTTHAFVMELRLVKKDELKRPIELPQEAVADITPRRLQNFVIQNGAGYLWSMTRTEKTLQSGRATADAGGVLTIPAVAISDTPAHLRIVPDTQTTAPPPRS